MLSSKLWNITTLHAPPLAVQAENTFMKLFWWLCTIAGIALVIGTSWNLLSSFISNSVVTVVSVVSTNSLVLPNVTLCSLTRINRTALTETGYWKRDPNLHLKLLMLYYNPYSTANYEDELIKFTYGFDFAQYSPEFLHSLLLNVSFDCSSFLFDYCSLEGETVPCMEWGRCYLSHNGPCFSLSMQNLTQRIPGPKGGLMFYFRETPGSDILNDTIFNSYSQSGIQVFTSPEDSVMERSPILVPFGSLSKISLFASHTQLLPQRTDGCIPKSTLNDTHYFVHYSSRRCQIECMLTFIKITCDCFMFSTFLSFKPRQLCDPIRLFQCFALNQTAIDLVHGELATCRESNCRDSCEHWRYTHTTTNSEYISDVYNNAYALAYTTKAGKSGLAKIELFYNDIQYTNIQEKQSVTLDTFISNIGGNFGLYTGGSLVTLVHFVYYIIRALTKFWRKKHPGKSPILSQPQLDSSFKIATEVGTAKKNDWDILVDQNQDDPYSFKLSNYRIPRPKTSEYVTDGNFLLQYKTS